MNKQTINDIVSDQFFPPEVTTHRFFIKLDGRIYHFDLPGAGDPMSPYCYGINLDRDWREPVVESICSLKCYPTMVEDWLTYYHSVGCDAGEEVNGMKPMVLKSSKSVHEVEADLTNPDVIRAMKDERRAKHKAEMEKKQAEWDAKPQEEKDRITYVQRAEVDAMLAEIRKRRAELKGELQ